MKDPRQELFNFLYNNGFTPLEDDMNAIRAICKEIDKPEFPFLNSLSRLVFEDNAKKGFWEGKKNVGEVLMLVVSELAEAVKADRENNNACRDEFERGMRDARLHIHDKGGDEDSYFKMFFEDHIKNSFEDEISDTVIRLLDLCGGFGIDLSWHVENKLRYNRLREYKHGKQY